MKENNKNKMPLLRSSACFIILSTSNHYLLDQPIVCEITKVVAQISYGLDSKHLLKKKKKAISISKIRPFDFWFVIYINQKLYHHYDN